MHSFISLFFLYYILSLLHLLTCVWIVWDTSSHLPLPTLHHFQAEPHALPCWGENIRDNKKDIVFLLVWCKHSYTERFLALFQCTCALQPTLVYLCQITLLLPGPVSTMASASLRLLFSREIQDSDWDRVVDHVSSMSQGLCWDPGDTLAWGKAPERAESTPL
jgi:hypothetical protein